MAQQKEERKAEALIHDYYQGLVEEDYDKAFEQLQLYDVSDGKRVDTSRPDQEAEAFYKEKIDARKDLDFQIKDYEITEIEYEDGHSFWHHVLLHVEEDGETYTVQEKAFLRDEKLLISSGHPLAELRDGNMSVDIDQVLEWW
ncbi:hypothetical protein LCM20_01405 [Halobacillus litoralis]|uniref:hypothetical protein n=1 Tax=Halobacillus litoralis TaxID=45668 RepID=UPI001CD7D93A|nr:hypothetical protein [Halobacillus litoralis]MCA0969242.1 hypothetical protein [Halobacillus litoralis]